MSSSGAATLATVATTPSLKVIKQMTYRGQLKQFSNRYHFNGGTPPDNAHWTTFSDAVVAAEKAIYSSAGPDATIVETVGYAAGSEVPVFFKTYSVAATGVFANFTRTPGDVAGLIRYATTARTSKNHPVYLFNYYHCFGLTTAGSRDDMNAAQQAAAGTYAAAWIAGFSDGATTYHRAGPNGATATGYVVQTVLTHRDFPRA